MWGNAQGWFLAMVMLGGLVFSMHKLSQLGDISAPTAFGQNKANLGQVALPVSPARLLDTDPNLDGTLLYRVAIEHFRSNPGAYERFHESGTFADGQSLLGIQKLLEATRAGKAAIFAGSPTEIVTYGLKPQLEAVVSLGHACARAALLRQIDDPNDAIRYFKAEFALGFRLYEERLTVDEFLGGLELMSEAAAGLARVYQKLNQPDRAAEFQEFNRARTGYYDEQVLPVLRILQSIDANIIGQHAGDIFHFARYSHERMYRVEAIFALGRMRFFVGTDGRVGDQRGAIQELDKLANDPDPIIQLAASRARELTIEQYRMLK